ncbi:MAG: ATP-binding cassette domain-containing protein [Caulobacteraceae bacterium]
MGIKEISFKLYHSQILGITGAQACGKSTLLKLIYGIISTSEGIILHDGKRVGCKELSAAILSNYKKCGSISNIYSAKLLIMGYLIKPYKKGQPIY